MISWNTSWPIWKPTRKQLFRTLQMAHSDDILILPLSVVNHTDVVRLLREIQAVDDSMKQAAIREPGTNVKLPKTGRLLDQMLETNKLNILMEPDRKRLLNMMVALQEKAPI